MFIYFFEHLFTYLSVEIDTIFTRVHVVMTPWIDMIFEMELINTFSDLIEKTELFHCDVRYFWQILQMTVVIIYKMFDFFSHF